MTPRLLLCVAGPLLIIGLALCRVRNRGRGVDFDGVRLVSVEVRGASAPRLGTAMLLLALLLGGIAASLSLWGEA